METLAPSLALSIRQPWTELILRGIKTIEVRKWSTHHRGKLWIHVGIHRDFHALRRFNFSVDDLAFGAIVGVCELYDCIEFSQETWNKWRSQHLNEGDLYGRYYAWLLKDPVRVSPRPLKGRLGLMRIDAPHGGARNEDCHFNESGRS